MQTFGEIAERRDEAPGHMPGMRAREPDPLDARHVVDGLEQPRKVTAGVVGRLVVIDDLAEELHLAEPLAGRGAHLVEDLGLRTHALVAARVRHDAEAAALVAALDDRDPRPDRVVSPRQAERERHVVVRAEVDAGAPGGLGFLNQQGQHAGAPGADDDVHE